MITFKNISMKNFDQVLAIDSGIERIKPVVHQLAIAYVCPSKKPLAIYEDDKCIGFMFYELDINPEVAYDIQLMMIDKSLQRQGLGYKVMLAFVNYLDDKGITKVLTLTYHKDNKAAKALYSKLGFIPTPNPEQTEPSDGIRMRLQLK